MADKRRVKRSIKGLQRVKTWQLVILFILALFVTATFLRLNNIGMVEGRTAVLTADEAGNSETIANRLYDLQRYVSAHMNTDMGKGLYLETSYKRDYQAAFDSAYRNNNLTINISKKTQEVCLPQFSRCFYVETQCTSDELTKCSVASDITSSVKKPDVDNYFHVFISPLWSPDVAGWLVVFCIVLCMLIIARFLSFCILKIILYYRYKSI